MIAAIIVLAVLMVLMICISRAADDTLSGCSGLLGIACFIAIGVLGAILAWRYLP